MLWTSTNFSLASSSRRKKQEFARDFDRCGKKAWRVQKTVSRGTANMPEKERKGVGNYSSEVRNPQ